jgi:hypothetical protein
MKMERDRAIFEMEEAIERTCGIRTATLSDKVSKLTHENYLLKQQLKQHKKTWIEKILTV